MADIHGLKNEARRQEQRENWDRAIDLYTRAIESSENDNLGPVDLSLYNRVGDLHQRRGNTEAAVACYERAIEGYAGQQLHANAIALCNKVLRIAPARTEIYLRLGRLSAESGLYAKARGDYLTFAERMGQQGRMEEALAVLDEFSASSGQTDIRQEFSERLRRAGLEEEARLVECGGEVADGAGGGPKVPSRAAAEVSVTPPTDDAEPPGNEGWVNLGSLLGVDPLPPQSAAGAVHVTGDRPDSEFNQILTRFRTEVSHILEDSDHAVHYDLGIAYMGMGLIPEAIVEFQLAIQGDSHVEAAHEMLGRCLRRRRSQKADAPWVELDRSSVPVAESVPTVASDAKLHSEAEMVEDATELGLGPDAVEMEGEAGTRRVEEMTAAAEPEPPGTEENADSAIPGLLFEARLAQHRALQAESEHSTDFHARLELGLAYREMGLYEEAVRELGNATTGPKRVARQAEGALREISEKGTELTESVAEGLRQILAALPAHAAHDADRGEAGPAGGPPAPPTSDPASDESGSGSVTVPPVTAPPEGDPAGLVRWAEVQLAAGERALGIGALRRARDLYERDQMLVEASTILGRLLKLLPDDTALHRRRVEHAFQANDRGALVRAYLDLAACLQRQGALREARTVYGQILDVSPGHEAATTHIVEIDEAQLRREREHTSADRVPAPSRKVQGETDFDTILHDLRSRDEDSSASPAPQSSPASRDSAQDESHIELGIAFTKMNMWDDAIREFQAAMRVEDRCLQAFELLGECFNEKGKFGVAARTLERGLAEAAMDTSDEDLLGILYQLGVAREGLGNADAAREFFERVFAVDIDYRDVSERLQ